MVDNWRSVYQCLLGWCVSELVWFFIFGSSTWFIICVKDINWNNETWLKFIRICCSIIIALNQDSCGTYKHTVYLGKALLIWINEGPRYLTVTCHVKMHNLFLNTTPTKPKNYPQSRPLWLAITRQQLVKTNILATRCMFKSINRLTWFSHPFSIIRIIKTFRLNHVDIFRKISINKSGFDIHLSYLVIIVCNYGM